MLKRLLRRQRDDRQEMAPRVTLYQITVETAYEARLIPMLRAMLENAGTVHSLARLDNLSTQSHGVWSLKAPLEAEDVDRMMASAMPSIDTQE